MELFFLEDEATWKSDGDADATGLQGTLSERLLSEGLLTRKLLRELRQEWQREQEAGQSSEEMIDTELPRSVRLSKLKLLTMKGKIKKKK